MGSSNTNTQRDPMAWLYSNPSDMACSDPLQEPVPFEDFKFSFGLDPDFSVPIPLDILPMNMSTSADDLLGWTVTGSASTSSTSSSSSSSSTMSQSSPSSLSAVNSFGMPTLPLSGQSGVLDEDEQRAFSSFLDSFFVDKDVGILPCSLPSLSNLSSEPPSAPPPPVSFPSFFSPKTTDDAEESRRHSILQSLDQSKRLQRRINLLATLPAATKVNPVPLQLSDSRSIYGRSDDATIRLRSPGSDGYSLKSEERDQGLQLSAKRLSADDVDFPASKRSRSNRDLLTEQEKRANHIASEQKRRSTIRNGFKELTDLIPTLKNINNSKSTVLFKAVDYIKYLEKRNKGLRDVLYSLEMRAKVQGRSGSGAQWYAKGTSTVTHTDAPSTESVTPPKTQQQMIKNDTTGDSLSSATVAALLAHKTQQKQLLQLQEQLRFHQRLLAQQEELKALAEAARLSRQSSTVAPSTDSTKSAFRVLPSRKPRSDFTSTDTSPSEDVLKAIIST